MKPHPALLRTLRSLSPDAPLLGLDTLSASQLRTVELALYAARSEREAKDLLRQFSQIGAVQPCAVDGRELHDLDGLAWAVLPRGAAVLDLPPVQPLGLSHVLSGTPQDAVLSATRNTEVCGDPTSALTLALVERRRSGQGRVRLASSFRTMRMQPLSSPSHTVHFRLLALVSGRRTDGTAGELEMLNTHIGFYLRWLESVRHAGYAVGQITVRLTHFGVVRALCSSLNEELDAPWRTIQDRIEKRGIPLPHLQGEDWSIPGIPAHLVHQVSDLQEAVVPELARSHPGVRVSLDLRRIRQVNYYTDWAYHIDVDSPAGPLTLVDGGFVDWSQRLLNNRKERELTSGAGTELLARLVGRSRTEA